MMVKSQALMLVSSLNCPRYRIALTGGILIAVGAIFGVVGKFLGRAFKVRGVLIEQEVNVDVFHSVFLRLTKISK